MNRSLLVSRGQMALEGSILHHVTLNLLQNSPDNLRADIVRLNGGMLGETSVIGAEAAAGAAKQALQVARTNRNQLERQARKFCADAIDTLKGVFGRRMNPAWAALRLGGTTLTIPSDCLDLLANLRSYFEREPGHAHQTRGLTADAASALYVNLSRARSELQAAKRVDKVAQTELANAVTALRNRLGALGTELKLALPPDDPRWYDFGLRRPVDCRIPDPVQEVSLTSPLPGEIRGSWEAAKRATGYRVLYKRPADEVFLAHEVVKATQFTLGGMPSGAEVVIRVTSLNRTGETAVYAEAKITVN